MTNRAEVLAFTKAHRAGNVLLRRWALILGFILGLLAFIWVITFQRIDFERGQEVTHARRQSANLAMAFQAHIQHTLKAVHHSLMAIAHQYIEHGNAVDLRQMARDGLVDTSLLSFVGIVRTDGMLVLGTGADFKAVDVSDRDYYRANIDGRRRGLFVGKPLIGRISQRAEVPLSFRMEHADGSFAGLVIVGLDANYFSNFFAHIDVGRDGMIQIIGLDGIVRSRWDVNGSASGQDMSNSALLGAARASDWGDFVSAGRLDGIARYTSFRVLRDEELVVAVGASVEETLAPFNARRRNYLAAAWLITTLLAAIAGALTFAMNRQRRAMLVVISQAERLDAQLEELRRFQRLCVDRELRMIELKEELARRAGPAPATRRSA